LADQLISQALVFQVFALLRNPRYVPNSHQRNRVRVHFRQLEAWYRTLDQLLAAEE
jgi:hypothetical protein